MDTNMAVDPKEIAKFEAMAKEWWDSNGNCKPLHDINPLRTQFVLDNAGLENKQVLDVGCGAGILSESMRKKKAHVTGIDASEKLIQIAQKHAKDNQLSIQYDCQTAEAYAVLYPATFDIVTCMELLEHVPDPHSVIHACAKLVKPQGYVFFSTLNRNLKAYLQAIIGAEYVLGILPRNTHQYDKFIKPSELAEVMRAAELGLQTFAGISYNPFTGKAILSSSISVNYIAVGKRN